MSPFTGQRAERGFGLLDYNARYYDAKLQRFISADTVIPGAANAKAWDRYAYAMNNPVKYVDPSGNNPECGPDGVYCDNDEWNDYEYDPVALSESGNLLLTVARELDKLTGGRFTLRSLIRIIFERELDGFGKLTGIPEVYAEAVGRNYWNWAQGQYGTHTGAALLNWLGGHNSVAQSLYTDVFVNLPAGNLPFGLDQIIGQSRNYAYNAAAASRMAAGVLNTPDQWKTFDPDAPYTFGFCKGDDGPCMIKENKRGEFGNLDNTDKDQNGNYIFSTDIAKMYFKFDISYIATYNQAQYWEGK